MNRRPIKILGIWILKFKNQINNFPIMSPHQKVPSKHQEQFSCLLFKMHTISQFYQYWPVLKSPCLTTVSMTTIKPNPSVSSFSSFRPVSPLMLLSVEATITVNCVLNHSHYRPKEAESKDVRKLTKYFERLRY